MDNLTHSLTGVLAARVLPDDPADPAGRLGPNTRPKTGRAVFWTMLISANFPDIDIVANLFADPLTSLHYHRGITHSVVAAPFFALVPALVSYLLFIRGGFGRLWLYSLVGILVHILFDLITAFGTQLLAPVSNERFSLDWMFIIDPWFTGGLSLLLAAGKIFPRARTAFGAVTVAVVVLYLGAEWRLRSEALGGFRSELERSGARVTSLSALPQPLSVLKWVGLATTDSGAVRQFILLHSDSAPAPAEYFANSTDTIAQKAAASEYAAQYLRFARFPTLSNHRTGDFTVVEFRDLQFSIDPALVAAVGMGERDVPFVLRMEYDRSDRLISVTFNDEAVPLR